MNKLACFIYKVGGRWEWCIAVKIIQGWKRYAKSEETYVTKRDALKNLGTFLDMMERNDTSRMYIFPIKECDPEYLRHEDIDLLPDLKKRSNLRIRGGK